MPANLTPQYHEAERRFREAPGTEERIAALEEMLAVMPKHKGTDKLKAQLRRRISDLQIESRRQATKKGHDPWIIRKEGAGQVALLGLPNSGKSALISRLTKAVTTVAPYPYTTRLPIPGMMAFENIQIQLLDMPPLMDEAAAVWMGQVLQRADALALVVDASDDPPAQLDVLLEGLREMHLSLGGQPDAEGEAQGEFRVLRGCICLTKSDLVSGREETLLGSLDRPVLPRAAVSAEKGIGLDRFRRAAFEALGIIRVYTKAPRDRAETHHPVVLPAGATLEAAARSIHKDFAAGLKYARVWGRSVFEGQMAGREHILQDGDIVEFHL